jgi:hypothetical protein
MANLKLDNNYSVSMDTYNFTLKSEFKTIKEIVKDGVKENKEVVSKDEWHFPTFQLAIQKYLNECIRPLNSIIELQKELQRIDNLIQTLNK